jgi:lycopene beta-cyclase
MTYLQFHLVFIIPPLVLLMARLPRASAVLGPRACWTLPAIAVIALVYTTPWDNYLVYRGIWWYGPDRVIGAIGYVPVEEYLFFVLQPLLTGAWTYEVLVRSGWGRAGAGRSRTATNQAGGEGNASPDEQADTAAGIVLRSVFLPLPTGGRALGIVLYLLAASAGALALTYTRGVYLGLILVWAAPVLAAQWAFVARAVLRAPRAFVTAVAVPTLYLWFADRIAIGAGIWSISPEYTTGLHLLGLPVEEALFFLVTNLLVVQGVLLFLDPHLVTRRAARTAA